jgi:hypothetical protein
LLGVSERVTVLTDDALYLLPPARDIADVQEKSDGNGASEETMYLKLSVLLSTQSVHSVLPNSLDKYYGKMLQKAIRQVFHVYKM